MSIPPQRSGARDPITEGDRAFAERWATFDCGEDKREKWVEHFERQGLATWLSELRRQLEPSPAIQRLRFCLQPDPLPVPVPVLGWTLRRNDPLCRSRG